MNNSLTKTKLDDIAKNDFKNTLNILFDGNGAKTADEANVNYNKAFNSYKKQYSNIIGENNENFQDGALDLHLRFDCMNWFDLLAFKSVAIEKIKLNPKNEFKIVDVLTAISKALNEHITVPTKEIFPKEINNTLGIFYNDRFRLESALNFYKLMVFKIFKHFLRINSKRNLENSSVIGADGVYGDKRYFKFFEELQKDFTGIESLDNVTQIDKRENYLSKLGFVAFNWDPILPFYAMKTNYKLNKALFNGSIYPNTNANIKKRLYMDFGMPLGAVNFTIEAESENNKAIKSIGFTPSENEASFVNSMTKESFDPYDKYSGGKLSRVAIKLIKLFGPHGFINLRICPRCQNPFMFFNKRIGKFNLNNLHELFVSDPIPSEYDLKYASKNKILKKKYESGKPDELDCPFCEHNVYFKNSFMEIQSIIKFPQPPAVSKVYYDYGNAFGEAEHLVSLGYSFPDDDVIENIFLDTMRIKISNKQDANDIRITYVGFKTDSALNRKTWYGFNEVCEYFERKYYETKKCGDYYEDLKVFLRSLDNLGRSFKRENIRFNFFGFPNILEKTTVEDIVNFKPVENKKNTIK